MLLLGAYSDGSLKNLTIEKNLYRVLHEYEQAIYGYKPSSYGKKIGEPEVVFTYDSKFVPLNENWQNFWFQQLVRASKGTMTHTQLLQVWESLTANGRAFTDGRAVQNGYADYILGDNLHSSPICENPLVCGGNVVAIHEDDYFYRGGDTYYYFETLDPTTQDPPDVNKINSDFTPWLIQYATVETPFPKGDGTWLVNPFPQLGGNLGVPFPIVSIGKNYIASSKIIKITDGRIPSPYNE